MKMDVVNPPRRHGKKPSVKSKVVVVKETDTWKLTKGCLATSPGRPRKEKSLFKAVGEKIPYEFIDTVRKELSKERISLVGVYIAHDSMGYPRYIGRGNIFVRLKARRSQQILELSYFSFFVVENKTHEREIETIMIRAAGPLLHFNKRKVRNDIQAGDVRDFEQGTLFVERQYNR